MINDKQITYKEPTYIPDEELQRLKEEREERERIEREEREEREKEEREKLKQDYLNKHNKLIELQNEIKSLSLKVIRRNNKREMIKELRREMDQIMPKVLRVKRLRDLLPYLQDPTTPRKEIAEIIGVKERTLYNYMKILRNNGFTIPVQRLGKQSYYEL